MDIGGYRHNNEGFYENFFRSNLYLVDIVMYYCGLAIILIPLSDLIMFNVEITDNMLFIHEFT